VYSLTLYNKIQRVMWRALMTDDERAMCHLDAVIHAVFELNVRINVFVLRRSVLLLSDLTVL